MTPRDVKTATTPDARQLLIGGCLLGTLALATFYLPNFQLLRTPLACVLPIAEIYGIVLAISVLRKGPDSLSWGAFLAGAFVVAGGPCFDVCATLWHDPALHREVNLIARHFLDSGVPLPAVLVYGLIAQAALATLFCLLWAGFLKHKRAVLELAREEGSSSTGDFIKAAFGGAGLTWRQCFFPLKPSEFPASYPSLWLLTVAVVGGSLGRWYLGFEWFGFFYGYNIPVIIAGALSAVGIYVAWLWRRKKALSMEL